MSPCSPGSIALGCLIGGCARTTTYRAGSLAVRSSASSGRAKGWRRSYGNVGKDELVRDVAEKSGLGVGEAKRALEATLRAIEEQMGEGNEVRLTGFGKFSVSQRSARQGRNPRTGAAMQIAAKSVPKFSAGTELKKAVR